MNLDEDGKLPLSNKEYMSLQMVIASMDSLDQETPRLERRAKLAGGSTWRDLRMLTAVAAKVFRSLMGTIPLRKLRLVQEEIRRTEIIVNVRPPHGLPQAKGVQYTAVPVESLEWMIDRVLKWECFACQREGKEQKSCPFRQRLETMYTFDLPDLRQGECPFATIDHLSGNV